MKVDVIYAGRPKDGTMNGILRQAINMINGLMEAGVDVRPIPIKKIEPRIFGKPVGGWLSQRVFLQTLRRTDADIVHSVSLWMISPNTDIVHAHDIFPLMYADHFGLTNTTKRFYKRILNQAKNVNRVIVESNVVKESLVERGFDGNKIVKITTKVPQPENIGPNPYKDDGKIHLFTLGEFGKRKRFGVLYEYMQSFQEAELYHIGRVVYKNYYEECMKFKPPNVHYLGYKPEAEMRGYMKYADAFVYNTLNEGQGFAPMEAMRLNVKTIVNDLPVFRELLGDKAYYYNDVDGFIRAVCDKPKKTGLVEQIAQYDDEIEKTIKLYKEVLVEEGTK